MALKSSLLTYLDLQPQSWVLFCWQVEDYLSSIEILFNFALLFLFTLSDFASISRWTGRLWWKLSRIRESTSLSVETWSRLLSPISLLTPCQLSCSFFPLFYNRVVGSLLWSFKYCSKDLSKREIIDVTLLPPFLGKHWWILREGFHCVSRPLEKRKATRLERCINISLIKHLPVVLPCSNFFLVAESN